MFKNKCSFFDDTNPSEKEVSNALFVVRLATAIFFITHGYNKFFGEAGLDGFATMLANNDFPIVGILAFLVAFAELFGGIAILLGLFTRFSAFWLAVISLVAWATVKDFSLGMDGGDIDVLALGLTIALVFAGPGALSLSRKLKKDKIVATE